MIQHNRRSTVRRIAGISALAVLAAACSGSSDGAETDTVVPATETVAAPATAAPETVAAPVTEAPAEEPAIDPAEIPEVPCDEYVVEVGFPLKPCDSGVLVETLQRDLEPLYPGITIDGLYGGQTFGFIEEIQTAAGDEATGLVSEELADQIAAATSLDDLASGVEAPADTADTDTADTETDTETDTEADADAETDTEADTESEDVGEVTEELCNELIGDAANPNFTVETIEACSALGIDLVGES